MNKTKLSLAENIRFAIEIAIARKKIALAFDAIYECYPQKVIRAIKPNIIEEGIRHLQDTLDNQIFIDCPGLEHRIKCMCFSGPGEHIAEQVLSNIVPDNFYLYRPARKPQFQADQYRHVVRYLEEAKDLFRVLQIFLLVHAPKAAQICKQLGNELQQILNKLDSILRNEHGHNHALFQEQSYRFFMEDTFTDITPFKKQIADYLATGRKVICDNDCPEYRAFKPQILCEEV
jgi:hypothetical protein